MTGGSPLKDSKLGAVWGLGMEKIRPYLLDRSDVEKGTTADGKLTILNWATRFEPEERHRPKHPVL